MTPRRLYSTLLLAFAISGCNTVAPSNKQVVSQPPIAKRVPRATTIHGERLVDNYFWLRKKNDPAVLAYLQAEDAYTDWVMGPTKPLQETLYKEMIGRVQETDQSVPYRDGD